MKKIRLLLLMLMSFMLLSGCKTVDNSGSQNTDSSQSQSESHSEGEESSNTHEALQKINASIILDYGTIKANKVTPILDKEVGFDVSEDIANAVYGDEVIISYLENQEEYDVEIIEKDLIENITVFMAVAPGAQDDDFQCYTSESGIALSIRRVEYIINLDGSYSTRSEWPKFHGTPELYASYNPEESKQTTEFTVLHYLTALYSYNPRKVDK